MIFNGILELIGKTPVLKLNKFIKDENIADVYIKLEKFKYLVEDIKNRYSIQHN